MKVSEMWLREWVNPPLSGEALAHVLTMSGLEVENTSPVAGDFNRVVVGHVLSVERHPQADRLNLCQVDSGTSGVLRVVCGASNVRRGLKVALALEGAVLPNGMVIREAKVRGEPSFGMLCSESELGLAAQSSGIIELDDDAPVGMNLRDYLLLDDNVIEISITPNRADCLSVAGLARETGAITSLPVTRPPFTPCRPGTDVKRDIQLLDATACPIYYGRAICNINPHATSPLWLRERLRRAGIRPHHPVVDVSNYIMLEWGQPLHAFDLARIEGGIRVRRAQDGEQLELLDGENATLDSQILIIADEKKALAIAGVMGGRESAVDAETTDVFLESAWFSPQTIAGVARRFGLSSDAAQRYERGVDFTIQEEMLERATELLLSITGGTPGEVLCRREEAHIPALSIVDFNPHDVRRLTGLEVSNETMHSQLLRLGMQIDAAAPIWKVTVPAHRFDIRLSVDCVEEAARLTGYDNLPQTATDCGARAGVVCAGEAMSMRLGAFFSNRGYRETISYSFVDNELQQAIYPNAPALELLNPISSDMSHMRAGLWPGLLASMLYNTHRQQQALRLFETGVVFRLADGALTEHLQVGGLLTGPHPQSNWSLKERPADFFDLKGDLQALFAHLGVDDVQFCAATHDALHPGQSAQIRINGAPAGWMGVLHPRLLDALDCTQDVVLFELEVAALQLQADKRYQPVSRFPQIRRDLSLLVPRRVTADELESVVRAEVPPALLRRFRVFDVYEGKGIAPDQKSIAITLCLQDPEKTLEEAGINAIIGAIIRTLEEKLSITLRE